MTKSKSPPNNGDSKLFYPETIIVTPQARASPIAKGIIDIVRNKAPNIELIYSHDQRPPFPPGMKAQEEKYFYSRKTLTLSARTDSFIETFASPGHIIEEVSTIVKSLGQCSNSCEYCYLQRTAIRQPWQRVYANFQNLEREMLNETVLHPALLSLISIISFHEKKVLEKIPKGFKETADKLRLKLSRKGRVALTENQVKLYFRDNLKEILSVFGISCDSDNLKGFIAQFMEFYQVNKSYPLWFNISEYTDIVSSNHLHHQLEMFFDIVDRNENINIQFFTKSANMDSLLENYKGHDRIRIMLNLSTEYVQEKYEHGTSSLSERLRIAEKIQKSPGFRLVLHLEPIIKYPGYEEEYLDLVKTLMRRLDPKKLDGITLGSIRYAGNLKSAIWKNYPETDLFSAYQGLVKPKHKFDRYRYPLEERVKIYSLLIDEIRKHTNVPVRFGAETPELWLRMGFSSEEFLRKYYYQYPGEGRVIDKITIKRNNALNEMNKKEIRLIAELVLTQGMSVKEMVKGFSLKYPEIDEETVFSAIQEELHLLAEEKFSKAPLDKTQVRIFGNKAYYNIRTGSLDIYRDPETGEIFLNFSEIYESISSAEPAPKNQMNLLNLAAGRELKNQADLIDWIADFIQKYIRLKDPNHYTFLAVYVVLSYIYKAFQVIPYIKLKGDKGTGKTTVLLVLNALMNNAKFASNITPSALYRAMEDGGSTLLIDEAEYLHSRKSSNETFMEVLNSGYHSSGTVIRTIEGTVIEFSTFGPKVIASINDLAPATEDRTIIVETDQDKSNGTVQSFIKEAATEEIQAIKAAIFAAVPDLLKSITEELKSFDGSEGNEFSIGLKNRHKDRWISILILTKLLSRGKKKHIKAIVKAAKLDIELKDLADMMSPETIALDVLSDIVSSKDIRIIARSAEYICVEAKPVSEAIINSDVQKHFRNQGHVTLFLKTRGVIVERKRVEGEPTIIYKIPTSLKIK